MYRVVKPAYGRVLNTQKEVRQHYNNNLDFLILDMLGGGSYINKSDAQKSGVKLEVRYGKRGEKVIIL